MTAAVRRARMMHAHTTAAQHARRRPVQREDGARARNGRLGLAVDVKPHGQLALNHAQQRRGGQRGVHACHATPANSVRTRRRGPKLERV